MLKRLLFSLLILQNAFNLLAQGPVIEAAYLPVKGTSYMQIYDTTAQALVLPTFGPNQIWDYSDKFVNITDTFVMATFDPDTTPYAQLFPAATHASFVRAPYMLGDSVYSYYVIDHNGIFNIGGFNIKPQYNTDFHTIPAELVVPSTVSYTMAPIDNYSETVSYSTYQGYDIKLIQKRTKNIAPVGYGNLKTPIGSFSDVLLTRETTQRRDSFLVKIANDYVYQPLIMPVQVENFNYYFFYRNNTFGSTILMMLKTNIANTLRYGFYSLPTDFGSISGHVSDSTGASLLGAGNKVLLYRDGSNFNYNDILDTAHIDVNGNYLFDSIPFGKYRIAVRPNPIDHADKFTTFFGNTQIWTEATPIDFIEDTNGINIIMVYKPSELGNGNISGLLVRDYDFSGRSVTGDPIPGVDIVVEKTPSGVKVSQGTTDSNGNYSMNSLPDGDYQMFVNIPGLRMAQTYLFSLNGTASINGLDFVFNEDSIYAPNQAAVGVLENNFLNNILIYPNPFDDIVTLKIEGVSHVSKIEIFNLLGERLATYDGNIKVGEEQYFNFRNLKITSGIYIVRVHADGKTSNLKIIRKK